MKEELIVNNCNLTGLTHFLNENFKKKNGKNFSARDVLSYIRRGYLPTYLGNYKIQTIVAKNCSVKLYKVIKNENIS